MTIRVAIVDDQALVRAGLSAIVDAQDDLEVVGEAADGLDAVALALRVRPDVMLMDIRMPTLDGIAATARIHEALAQSPPAILVLTTFDLDEHVFAALRAGAAGFLVKDTPPEQLLDAIRTLAVGDALLGSNITRRLINEFVRHSPTASAATDLEFVTPRERDVLELVGRGLTNGEIASRLFVSEATVKSHLGRVTAKLNITSRAQAVVYAYEHRLVAPSPRTHR